MKTTSKIIAVVATTAALALATAVSAQPGFGPGFGGPGGSGMGPGWGRMGGWGGMGPGAMGPGWGGMGPGAGHMGGGFGMMGFGGFDMSAAAAGRLAAFKSQLKITPAQESAWKAYESAVTEQAKAMQTARDQFRSKWQNLKPGEAAPDMTAQHQAMFALQQSGWEAQNKALKDLNAVLTTEQQAFAGGGRGPRGMPRR
jgi:hypothetical protein